MLDAVPPDLSGTRLLVSSTAPVGLRGFLRLPQVLQLFPVSESVWWEGIHAGRYPSGHKLAPRVTAWAVDDIEELLERVRAGEVA